MRLRATISWLAALASLVLSTPVQADERRDSWLAAHNVERAEFGVLPLRWSDELAAEAQVWARTLATDENMRHSTKEERGGRGENLWMGTAGYYTPEQMIGHFADEKQHFHTGRFPDVSKTGDWADVGHYTQLVWPATREVGCATARGARYDFLVCRYWPAGNVMGQRIFPGRRVAAH
ncbi:MAG: CAP domain-containing protein [Erythrobacter sp.]